MQLKNISEHRPKDMVIDVAENDAKELIKTGEFIELTKEKLIIEKPKEIVEEPKEDSDTLKKKKL